jgi:hypothetical protein
MRARSPPLGTFTALSGLKRAPAEQDAPPCGVASSSLWFRLTLLVTSLTDMATTIVAEEGARCGVVGMIALGAG